MGRLFVAIGLLLVGLISLTGCQQTLTEQTVGVSKVRANPLKWNEKIINLKGFIEVERTGNSLAFPPLARIFATRKEARAAHVYPGGENVEKSIDLRPSTKAINQELTSFHAIACVVLRGKFKAYHGLFMGIGVYASDTGIIKVTSVRRCGENPS